MRSIMASRPHKLSTLTALLLNLTFVLGEPAQYCRFGHSRGAVDFCLAVANTFNATNTSGYDLWLTLTVTKSGPQGWTAIGTGEQMAGALMFIAYGDPTTDSSPPVLSIRSVDGHHQPKPVTNTFLKSQGVDLRILRSEWTTAPENGLTKGKRHDDDNDDQDEPLPDPNGRRYTAVFSVVCFNCGGWPGSSPIRATSAGQPFIWAWNNRQEMKGYDLDQKLDMHRHHEGNGGYGRFYVDMNASRIDGPTWGLFSPEIQEGVERIHSSDMPMDGSRAGKKGWPWGKTHGWLMGTAFLGMFPLGVVLVRSPGNAFKRHWTTQVLATGTAWTGAAVGLIMSGGFKGLRTTHQWVGLIIMVALGIQGILGWRHHLDYLRIRRRTWISYGHIWLGRTGLTLGWINVLTGLVLAGHGRKTAGLVLGLVIMEVVGVSIWVWLAQRRKQREQKGEIKGVESHALIARQGGSNVEDYSALEMSDGEETEDEEGDGDVAGEGEKEGKKAGNGKYSRLPKKSVDIAAMR
ncbi:hypothetical protein QBC46DRAFT_391682 [Diplogelasinospora grovesii]|uniref:Cytochrome b561 domain-containing protein n=1 Tax=Diplogelasinospora grovesii TaxID=303347 RepID=A0AAN6N297_9PEZI|nr:hypothetical protein QBC46DRAFT_391682 [Diplogelasinospora grovesii]